MLCPNGPMHAQQHSSDGVVSLEAHRVRGIQGVTQNDHNGTVLRGFSVDVEPAPIGPDNPEGLPENPAHAEIFTDPTCPDETVYRKLCKKLALLASQQQWEIPPLELRGT